MRNLLAEPMTAPDDDSQTPRAHRLERLLGEKAVAVLRTDAPASLPLIAEALLEGGISAIEVTMTVPDALGTIEAVRSTVGDNGIVGVGSVLGAQDALEAIQAGAEFVVSPVFRRGIVDTAHQHDVPALPGALTPTEIQTAHEAGADVVKVFPASAMGQSYLGAVKAPLPHLRLCPTGGISLEGAGEWLQAGAAMVGVGSALLDGVDLETGNYEPVTTNARRLRRSLKAVSEEHPE
jgi:2-dehydro-3-deoxyphosphogluconate aldolase/(4S)-4-hydroxy-2-oxoglutarate aldolase